MIHLRCLPSRFVLQNPAKGEGGIVYGERCAFFLTSPRGWALDNEAGEEEGLPVVFYAKGSSWHDASTAMYARSQPKKGRTLKAFLAEDRAEFLKKDPKIRIAAEPTLRTGDGRSVTILRYDSQVGHLHDWVAFIDLPSAFATLCLTSRRAAERAKHQTEFASLIGSFKYFTADVHLSAPRVRPQ